ncbi:MAG: hypothetical protein ACRDQA_27050 [Nocardioidaceae bacterium]
MITRDDPGEGDCGGPPDGGHPRGDAFGGSEAGVERWLGDQERGERLRAALEREFPGWTVWLSASMWWATRHETVTRELTRAGLWASLVADTSDDLRKQLTEQGDRARAYAARRVPR